MSEVKYRRRGTAIVETSQGILVVAGNHGPFMLPGGGANRGESRFVAALRELTEETSLRPYEAKVIFKHIGPEQRTFSGKNKFQDHHTVCAVKATGTIKLNDDAKRFAYVNLDTGKCLDPFNPGKDVRISHTTKQIIEKYRNWKTSKQEGTTDEDTSNIKDITADEITTENDIDE